MSNKVVIDKDILGWGDDNEEELLKQYDKVLKVGIDPDLPQRSFDDKVASYCRNNNCDLLTGDRTAYAYFFEIGISTLQITRYDYWKKGDRPVYRIKIIH